MTQTLAICIATWNSEKFLPELFESIFKQTVLQKEDYPIKLSINVVDSGSTDGSVSFLEKNYPEAYILKNTHNLGFARSYNQAIRMSSADFILVLNADVFLEDDYIEKLLTKIQEDKKIGSAAGKLLRARFVANQAVDRDDVEKTSIIDSCGLEMKRNRRFINLGEGEKDKGQYDQFKELFGFSAAAALYSRLALEEVRYADEYFDEDFFSYKEDVDLAWRLQIAGFKAVFVPTAKAYHFRTVQNPLNKRTNLKVARSYKTKNKLVRFHSYKNHLLILLKNETKRNFFKNFLPIMWYELRKLVYLLVFDWSTLRGLKCVIGLAPRTYQKRRAIMKHRRIKAEQVRRWVR